MRRRDWRAAIATVGAGIVLHGVIFASLLAFLAGRIGVVVLDAIELVNPVVAPLVVLPRSTRYETDARTRHPAYAGSLANAAHVPLMVPHGTALTG
jgi:hypothetical protein